MKFEKEKYQRDFDALTPEVVEDRILMRECLANAAYHNRPYKEQISEVREKIALLEWRAKHLDLGEGKVS